MLATFKLMQTSLWSCNKIILLKGSCFLLVVNFYQSSYKQQFFPLKIFIISYLQVQFSSCQTMFCNGVLFMGGSTKKRTAIKYEKCTRVYFY